MSLETKSVENGRFLGVKANDPERRSVHKMKADDLGENRRFLGQSRRSRLKWTISRVKSRWSRGIKRTILSEIWLFESRWSFESKRTILLEILSVGEPPILKDKCFRSYRLGSSALIHKIEKKNRLLLFQNIWPGSSTLAQDRIFSNQKMLVWIVFVHL